MTFPIIFQKGKSVIGLWFAEWRKKEVGRLMEEVKIRNISETKELNVNSYGQGEVVDIEKVWLAGIYNLLIYIFF